MYMKNVKYCMKKKKNYLSANNLQKSCFFVVVCSNIFVLSVSQSWSHDVEVWGNNANIYSKSNSNKPFVSLITLKVVLVFN